ncbi:MAG: DUF4352 domain-containing protein [Nitrososphaeria archaeon]
MNQAKGAVVAVVALIIGLVIGLFIPFGQVAPAGTITKTETFVATQPRVTTPETTVTLIQKTPSPPETVTITEIQTLIATRYLTSVETATKTVPSEAKTTEMTLAKYVRVLSSPVKIQKTWNAPEAIFGSIKAESGKVFAGFYVRVENHGYDDVHVSPFSFDVVVDNKLEYSATIYAYSIPDHLEDVTLLNGGTTEGWVLFEIPEDKSYERITLKADIWFVDIEYGELPEIEPP